MLVTLNVIDPSRYQAAKALSAPGNRELAEETPTECFCPGVEQADCVCLPPQEKAPEVKASVLAKTSLDSTLSALPGSTGSLALGCGGGGCSSCGAGCLDSKAK